VTCITPRHAIESVAEKRLPPMLAPKANASLWELLVAGGAPDPTKMKEVMLRHELVPVPQ
jgi:hypothetical protein